MIRCVDRLHGARENVSLRFRLLTLAGLRGASDPSRLSAYDRQQSRETGE
jgi:hypothetical protein